MLLNVFKSKIHRAIVTEADLNYVGSVTIDKDLLDASQILPGERVQVLNVNNGERLETYVIEGKAGSGIICLNGAAARKVAVNDVVIVISYALMTKEELSTHEPIVVVPDLENKIKEIIKGEKTLRA